MSKISNKEDDLVLHDALNLEVKIKEAGGMSKFNIELKELWKKRWKLLSCFLSVLCVIFLVIVCYLATQYDVVVSKLRATSRRKCKDICKFARLLYVDIIVMNNIICKGRNDLTYLYMM